MENKISKQFSSTIASKDTDEEEAKNLYIHIAEIMCSMNHRTEAIKIWIGCTKRQKKAI